MFAGDLKWFNDKGEIVKHDVFQEVNPDMVLGLLRAMLGAPPNGAVRLLYDLALPLSNDGNPLEQPHKYTPGCGAILS